MKFHNQIILLLVIIIIAGAIMTIENKKASQRGDIVREEISLNSTEAKTQADLDRISGKESRYSKAIELVSPDGYINTDNITIKELIGKKVILLDFWTYSCINCQRTLPYVTSWYEKYKDDGIMIIGVHTPEFDFEKDYNNVKRAVEKFNINYPVVQDNFYQTWQAYGNRYWPRKYLIDIDGFITYDIIGEGRYTITEQKIQEALEERAKVLSLSEGIDRNISKPNATDVNFLQIRTPEIYFGYKYARDGQLGNSEGYKEEEVVSYNLPALIKADKYYLDGMWRNRNDAMQLDSEKGKVQILFNAKNVYFVAGSSEEVQVNVKLDGKLVNNLTVKDFTLYHAVSLEDYSEHILELEIEKPSLTIFTFTFG